MKITGTETAMTATSGHTAHAVNEKDPYGRWQVSWLPGRTVSYNQATTALVLAECITSGVTGPAHPHWPHVQGWAGELDLTAPAAVAAVQRATTTLPTHTRKGHRPMSDLDKAISLYHDAVRHVDAAIDVIEDMPVRRLPDGHYRTAAQILADAYALRREITVAEHALENALKP